MSSGLVGKRHRRMRFGLSWLLLLALCTALLTAVDTFLIARSTLLFTGGFLVLEPLRSGAQFGHYLIESLVLDATLVLAIWLIAVPLLGRTRLAERQRLAAAGLLSLAPPLGFLYVRYHISRYLGHVLDPSLWLAIAGGSPVEWFAQASAQLVPVAATLAATILVSVALVWVMRKRGGVSQAAAAAVPTLGALAVAFGGSALGSATVLSLTCLRFGAHCEALEQKASGTLLAPFFDRVTDFDFDGYGIFPPLADQAPFDATRHPYALDVPGDGIDQNGLAGDHPLDYSPPADDFVEEPTFRQKPNVLMILLEGVRADILGAVVNGVPVTPSLDKLVAEGARSEHAYANSPYTALSRVQLMGGRLAPYVGQSTMIEDFHANGYQFAWVSGQDESFGVGDSNMLGLGRTDAHWDARDEVEHSVARYSTTGSLMISWKRVNDRIRQYLEKRRSDRPLFLYVNYGDTHFPYDHPELDDVLGVPRLDVRDIKPGNPRGVYETYANATANVDRAIGQLVQLWREKFGAENTAVIVTSDHGEALFEDGMLGHGMTLDSTQTRVPLVVVGLGGTWPEPFGLSDMRAALQHSLMLQPGDAPPVVRFEPVPGRQLLQYMALIEHPRLLCLRGLNSELRYDADDAPPPASPEFRTLIWWWESLQWDSAQRGKPALE